MSNKRKCALFYNEVFEDLMEIISSNTANHIYKNTKQIHLSLDDLLLIEFTGVDDKHYNLIEESAIEIFEL